MMLSNITVPVNVFRLFALVLTLFTLAASHAQELASPRVDSFSLVNADTGQEIELYLNSAQINDVSISSDSARRISFSFNASNTRSVSISGVSQQARVENQLPYSLLGDQGGVFEPWSPAIGVHTITVEPYSEFRLAGEKGENAVLRLSITEVAPQEPMPPVDAPATPGTTPSTTPGRPVTSNAATLPAIMQLLLENANSLETSPLGNNEDVCAAWDSTFPANAFTVSPNDRSNLQTLLDRHNVLRLSAGDYRSGGLSEITVNSGQSIIALNLTPFPDVKVAAGASGIRLEGLQTFDLTFEPGDSIRYNCFKNLRFASIEVNDATVERNLFVALANSTLDVDTSQRGHFSDNRFIKLNSHGPALPIVLKGDAARSSGGNAFLLVDSQTPLGSVISIEDQSDISFVGVDIEAYNQRHASNGNVNPFAFRVRNTGVFRAIQSSGMNRASRDPATSPGFDIDAEKIYMHQFTAPTTDPVLRVGPSNSLLFSWRNELSSSLIQDDSNVSNALRVFAQEHRGPGNLEDVSFSIGNTRLTREPSAETSNTLHSALTQVQAGSAAWGIPEFQAIPNPTGSNWDAGLDQRVDESAAIQAMIDANGVAYLEPRTYYINSTINLNRNQGIVGAGANRTAIVAMRPNLNMVNLSWNNIDQCAQSTSGFTLAEVTMQGGRNGLTAHQPGMQVNRSIVSHVTFRNMANAGILIDGIFGWDNNAHDYVNYVDSKYGIQQIAGSLVTDEEIAANCYGVPGEHDSLSYMDKTVFYRNQFLNLDVGVVMVAGRPNNLNGIVESSFENSRRSAIELQGGNLGFMVASSRFVNNAGNPVITGNHNTTVVNSYFEAGQGSSMVGNSVHVEGSTFKAGSSRSATVFGETQLSDFRNPRYFDVANSVLEIPIGPITTSTNITGMYLNNDQLSSDANTGFLDLIEFITNGTVVRTDDVRNIIPLLRGNSSSGSQLLRGSDWNVE